MATNNSSLISHKNVEEWTFDDDVQRKIVGTCLLIISIIGSTGNCMVIIAVSLTRKLQNVTNVFVMNLAIGDLFHCLILPFMVHDLYQPLATVRPNPVVCAINGVLTVLLLSVSVFSHALIAITRYVIITRPRRIYQTLFSTTRVTIFIFIVWIVSSIDPVLCMAGVAPLGYSPKYGICLRDIRYSSSVILSSIRSLYTNLLSVVVVLVCYINIFIYIRRHNRRTLKRMLTTSTTSGSESSRKSADELLNKASDVASTAGLLIVDESSFPLNADSVASECSKSVNSTMAKHCSIDGLATTVKKTHSMYIKRDAIPARKGRTSGIDTICEDLIDDEPARLDHNATHSNDILATAAFQITNPGRDSPDKKVKHDLNEDVTGDNCCNNSYPNGFSNVYPFHQQTEMATIQNTNKLLDGTCISQATSGAFSSTNADAAALSRRKNTRSLRWRSLKSLKRSGKTRREIDITKKLFVVMCVFSSCIIPYVFFVSIKRLERFLPYAGMLMALSSCLNPIIYGLSHPHFRAIFILLVSCQFSRIPQKTVWLTRLVREYSQRESGVH